MINFTKEELEDETNSHFSPKHHIFLARIKQHQFQLTRQGYDEALLQYEKTIALAPTYIQTHFGLLEFYLGAGDKEKVLMELKSLEELRPASLKFWETITLAYVFVGEEEKALRAVERGRAAGAAFPMDVLESLGRNAKARGMNESAFIFFKTALREGESTLTLLSLAEIYAQKGEYDEATRLASRALELDPSFKGEVEKFLESIKQVRAR